MQLRTWVNSGYHGGGPTQVNQPWCVIHFLHPNLISISLTTHPQQIHKTQVDSNCHKKSQLYLKREEEMVVEGFYFCRSYK